MSAVLPLSSRNVTSASAAMPVGVPRSNYRNYRTLDTVECVKSPSVASSLSEYSAKHEISSCRESLEYGLARVAGWAGGLAYFVSCLWIPLGVVAGVVYATMGLFESSDKENFERQRFTACGVIALGLGSFLGGAVATATWLAFSPILLALHGVDVLRDASHKRPDILSSFVHAVEQGGYDGGLFLLRMGDQPGEEFDMPSDVSDFKK